ncbi:hypothetical protein AVDCRST_MAG94-393 [uncultured Leptolyngbya sp.]|uniref:Uncharacterized protein n=1 Tax=uncultured Leptolyngbya sp. TaxID=332963 RepID=A0A6J4KBN8_9CYAN|nr:hypothetical protein AVDCRST_MAG94-393 [uncultured Leptolyngbya sp.]
MDLESFKIAIAKLKAEQEVKAKLANYLSKQSQKDTDKEELAT